MSNEIIRMLEKATPLNDKIIAVVVEKDEKQLESGIILTGESVNQNMEDFRRAKVISSATDEVLAGDIVIYLRFNGSPAGENMIILDKTDVLAKE